MSNIRKTDFWWQWRQMQQRLSEWLELRFNQSDKPTTRDPNPEFLQWLAPYLTWGFSLLIVGLLLFIGVRGFGIWQTRRLQQHLRNHPDQRTFVSPVSLDEWLKWAQQYQQQGEFTQAGRSLYFALLQNLHDRQIIPDQRSRTDQEYAAITRHLSAADAFATLFQTHERIEFAGDQLSAPDYQQCQQAYDLIQQAITSQAIAAYGTTTGGAVVQQTPAEEAK